MRKLCLYSAKWGIDMQLKKKVPDRKSQKYNTNAQRRQLEVWILCFSGLKFHVSGIS